MHHVDFFQYYAVANMYEAVTFLLYNAYCHVMIIYNKKVLNHKKIIVLNKKISRFYKNLTSEKIHELV